MRQEIYGDEYGFEAWETSVRSRCFVHILNSVQFFDVTGAKPPSKPPTAIEYTEAGLPWFDYYGGDMKALDGAQKLAGLDSVAVKKLKKGEGVLADNEPVQPKVVKRLGKGEGEGGGVLATGHFQSLKGVVPLQSRPSWRWQRLERCD